jgi:hypothetical protein
MSNSKLQAYQKAERKALKIVAKLDGVAVFHFPDMGVSVAMQATGVGNALFSVSVASPTEQKFRRKVGEFYALERFYGGQVLPARLNKAEPASVAQWIANAIGEARF